MAKKTTKELLLDVAWVLGPIAALYAAVRIQKYLAIPLSLFSVGFVALLFLTILLARYRQLHPYTRTSAILLTVGLLSLTVALFVNDYVRSFFRFSYLHLGLAMLPSLLYGVWRSHIRPSDQSSTAPAQAEEGARVSIEFSPGRYAGIGFVLGAVTAVAVACLVMIAGFSTALSPSSTTRLRWEAVILIGIGLYICLVLREHISGRHAYWTDYVLTDSGVVVSRGGAARELVPWSEFDTGVSKRLVSVVKLHCPRLTKPVVILNNGLTAGSSNFERARLFVASKLADRMRTAWL